LGILATMKRSLTNWLSKHQVSVFLTSLALLFVVVFFFDRIFITIPAGHRGVLFKMFFGGTVEDRSYGEGLVIAFPWNRMELYDVRLQSLRVSVAVMSKEGLSINVDSITRFTPVAERLGELHKRIGPEYVNKVMQPIVTSSVREVVGNYGPEELYAKGSAQMAEDAVTKEIVRELAGMPIAVDDFVVEFIGLPPSINQAIEDKLRHQQALLSYEFRLKSAEAEIINRRLEAEGVAAYNRVVGASLTPNVLRWLGIQATQKLAESPNTKILMFGGPDGLPVILNLEDKSQPAGGQMPGSAGLPEPVPGPPPAGPGPSPGAAAETPDGSPAGPAAGYAPGSGEGLPLKKRAARGRNEGRNRPLQPVAPEAAGQAPSVGFDPQNARETRTMLEEMMKRFEGDRTPPPQNPASPR
jgi:regulator of protease activity HflC (stomatin/prohibitin superfamily)